MKYILPLGIFIFLGVSAFAQKPYYNGVYNWIGITTGDSGQIGGLTTVSAHVMRTNGTIYRHTNREIIFSPGEIPLGDTYGWLTQFNDVIAGFGAPGNNVDSFLFQGNNIISGNNIVSFDTVYFNIGTSNTMSITNYQKPYELSDPTFWGNPPGGMAVARRLYFNNGLTTTNRNYPVNGAIVFVNNADYRNTTVASDAQHVDGFITEVNYNSHPGAPGHGGSFIYPVGNSTEMYQLQRTGIFTEEFETLTVGWVDGDPNTTPDLTSLVPSETGTINATDISHLDGLSSIIGVGFWDWHYQSMVETGGEALAMATDQNITVYIPNLTGLAGTLTKDDLRLSGWNPNTSKWINLGGTSGASGLTKGSTLSGVIPAGLTITALSIGSTIIVLPVTFGEFTVKPVNCTALLQWTTLTEQNNSHFNVERSRDRVNFTTIARVGAAGNSNTEKKYEFKDESPLSGRSYYRVTQVDFDGKNSSTQPVRIDMNCDNASLKVYPNPASNQLTITAGKAIAQVNILSSSGQAVMKFIPSLSQAGGIFNMNIQSIQSGIYIVQVINKDGSIELVKLLKK